MRILIMILMERLLSCNWSAFILPPDNATGNFVKKRSTFTSKKN
jgi:hypothetical protein